MDERRQLPRFSINRKVRVSLPQAEDINRCVIEDIHLKGMCVSFKRQLPTQGSLKMSFTIGEYFEPINIEAMIPWSKEDQGRYFYGLSFTQINDNDKDRIYKYLNAIHFDQFKDKWWRR
jgi:hypothetical protein